MPSQWIILLNTAVQYFDFNLKSGKTFLKEDCGKKCTCNNANLVCEDYSCPDPTICADNKCRCPKGFKTNPETGTCDGESPDLLTFNKSISSQIYNLGVICSQCFARSGHVLTFFVREAHLLCMRRSFYRYSLTIMKKHSWTMHCIATHSEQLRHCLKLFTYNVVFYELLPPCTCYSVEGQLLVVIHIVLYFS